MNVEFDYFRCHRIELPECVFCESKDAGILAQLLAELDEKAGHPVLLTRLSAQKRKALGAKWSRKLDYHALSRTAFLGGTFPRHGRASAAVVTAGSADLSTAWEAARTLEYLGIGSRVFADIGVAGLWRLEKYLDAIQKHDLIIAVAGMDAAIISVLGGLTARPVIAVPTSVGYGVAEGGRTALHSMLASCAPGIPVMNIDNGYGAACAAFRILKRIYPSKT